MLIASNLHSKVLTEGQVWWHAPVIPALRRLMQEDCRFKASLSYVSRLYFQTNNKKVSTDYTLCTSS
jgi:hypothetical protein